MIFRTSINFEKFYQLNDKSHLSISAGVCFAQLIILWRLASILNIRTPLITTCMHRDSRWYMWYRAIYTTLQNILSSYFIGIEKGNTLVYTKNVPRRKINCKIFNPKTTHIPTYLPVQTSQIDYTKWYHTISLFLL